MKRKWLSGDPPAEPIAPELRERKGAVTVPKPSPEQKAREDEQVRLLEAALSSKGNAQEQGRRGE